MKQVVQPESKDIIVQRKPQSAQRRPHQHCQQYKVNHRPLFAGITVTIFGKQILHTATQNHFTRLLAPPFPLAIHLAPVWPDDGGKLCQHILALHMLMLIAIVSAEVIILTLDFHQAVDDIMHAVEEKIYLPGNTCLAIL